MRTARGPPPGRAQARPAVRKPLPRPRRAPRATAPRGDEGDDASPVGEALVDMLRLQVGQEEIKTFAADEAAKLVESADKVRRDGRAATGRAQAGASGRRRRPALVPRSPSRAGGGCGRPAAATPHHPQIKAEADALAALREAEADTRFGAAMDTVNAMADELEAELAESRARLEAEKSDLADFEAATARARSAGHFFKSLFPMPEAEEGGEGGAGGVPPPPPSPAAAADASIRRAALDAAPPPPGSSSLRFGAWTVTAVALAGGAAANLFSAAPAVAADGVALALAAVLGYGAFVEGRGLDGRGGD